MQIARRLGAWAGESLPYDAEVQYIQSTGQSTYKCWLDLGFQTGKGFGFECEGEYYNAPVSGKYNVSIIGYPNVASLHMAFSDYHYIDNYFASTRRVGSAHRFFGKFKYVMKCNMQSGTVFRQMFEKGTSIGSWTHQLIDYTPTHSDTLNVFRGINNNWPVQVKARLDYLKTYDYDALTHDLIPVRFTNENGVSEGAMYDKVSKQLFRNQGTGSFVIGPDKIL